MSQQSASVQKGRAAYDNDVYGFRVVQSHYQQSDLKTVIFAAHMMSLSKHTQSTEAKKRQHTEPKKNRYHVKRATGKPLDVVLGHLTRINIRLQWLARLHCFSSEACICA